MTVSCFSQQWIPEAGGGTDNIEGYFELFCDDNVVFTETGTHVYRVN